MWKALFSRDEEFGSESSMCKSCGARPGAVRGDSVSAEPWRISWQSLRERHCRQKEQPEQSKEALRAIDREPFWLEVSFILRQHTQELWWVPALTFFLVGGLPKMPESSALGSHCLRSPSLLKVFQECGGLTHSLPWVHSLKFIKPLSSLVILIQTSAHMLHRWSWQEESGDTFFCSGCESRWGVKENKERLFTQSWELAPLAGV